MAMDQSNEEGFCAKPFFNFSSTKNLSVEFCALLWILQNGWNLDRSTPIRIVEALTVNQLLQMPFFQLTSVVDNFVVVRNDAAFVRLLAYDKEIVIQTNNSWVDESSRRHVWSVRGEKPLAVFEIHQHNCQPNASTSKWFSKTVIQSLSEVLLV